MPASLLAEMSSPDYLSTNFGSQLVEVLALVLDNEVRIGHFSHIYTP